MYFNIEIKREKIRCMPMTPLWVFPQTAASINTSISLVWLPKGDLYFFLYLYLYLYLCGCQKVICTNTNTRTFIIQLWCMDRCWCCRDAKTHMETLKTLMAANGHNNRKVFYLKVPIFVMLWVTISDTISRSDNHNPQRWTIPIFEGGHRGIRTDSTARVDRVRCSW